MHVVVLLKLSLIDAFLGAKTIGVLVLQENTAAPCCARYNCVHHYNVWFHKIICDLGARCIHKQRGNHYDKSATDQKTYVLVGELPILVGLIKLKNAGDLAIAEL